MTKLMQWLSVLAVYFAFWISFFQQYVAASEVTRFIVLVSPFILLVAFALYSIGVIAYRVATFNDCEEASKQLQQEIKEAKADLKKRGIDVS